MALIFLDEDPWLKEYDQCDHLCNEIAVLIENYSSYQSGAPTTGDISIRLRQCDQQLTQLWSALHAGYPSRTITAEENERRERLIENLMDKSKRLRLQFSAPYFSNSSNDEAARNLLFKSNDSQDTKITFNEANSQDRKATIIAEQDKGIEELSRIISRQKNIAQVIDEEVTAQTDIIDSLTDNIQQVGTRTNEATRRTTSILVTDNTYGLWLVVVLLFIAIIVVTVV